MAEEIEVFGVLVRNATYFVVLTDPNPERLGIDVATSRRGLFALLVSLNPRPKKVRQWARLFSIPEFLEFAKAHNALRYVKTWDAVFGVLH